MMDKDCYKCIYKRTVPGDIHISCTNPDPDMTGDTYGITQGWFFYPLNFDPIWATKNCCNFKEKLNGKS